MTASTATTWEQVRDRKQAERYALIPNEWRIKAAPKTGNVRDIPESCGILTDEDIKITRSSTAELLGGLCSGTLTSVAVTRAFCKRAAIAQQLTNCLTEILFEEGLKRAAEIDAEFAKTGKPIGPLHGLPVSLKDNVVTEGCDATVGFINQAFQPGTAETEAEVAKILRDAGAVFYCKTAIPAGMLAAETYNNVWGVTSNAYNLDLACGGSSGGEGVLLALNGSPLGVGTDIGGSVRIPCSLNGVYGLKPSWGRFPTKGIKAGLPGQEAIRAVVGPMANDMDSVELWSKIVLASKPWERDPLVHCLPWREVELPEKLCFGMIVDDGVCRPTPAVKRVLLETKAALEAAGHRVVEWGPPELAEATPLLFRLFSADGGATIARQIKGDIPEPYPTAIEAHGKLFEETKGNAPVSKLWELQAERQRFLARLLKAWYASKDVTGTGRAFDGVLTPVAPMPANRHKTGLYFYTPIWNVANQSAISFPAGHAAASDTVEGKMEYRNDTEKNVFENYDPQQQDGVPIGMSIVVTKHAEEEAIKLGRVAVEALAAYGKK